MVANSIPPAHDLLVAPKLCSQVAVTGAGRIATSIHGTPVPDDVLGSQPFPFEQTESRRIVRFSPYLCEREWMVGLLGALLHGLDRPANDRHPRCGQSKRT